MAKTALLLTGSPGCGKTSLIKEAVKAFSGRAGGFYTEELRREGSREGFQIVTLNGAKAVLAHLSFSSPFRVGRYGVDVAALEQLAVAAVRGALARDELVVVDEIGKMELYSPLFQQILREAINSGKKVLGTIMLAPHPFADEIKSHPQVCLMRLTRPNFPLMLAEVQSWLKAGS